MGRSSERRARGVAPGGDEMTGEFITGFVFGILATGLALVLWAIYINWRS